MIQINKIKEPFIYYCQKVIPLAFDESLSYYEVLCHLTAKIKKVIDEQNIEGQAIQELQEKYLLLVDYVDHYFDNLDIQEEINNKLDEMAESGELADIIAQYLGLAGMLVYDTLQDMKIAENITNGSICKTLGYNIINDGGNGIYKVRTVTTSDNINDGNIVPLYNNTIIAELITNNQVNVKQFGAIGDGITDDYNAFNNALNYCIDNQKTLYIPNGTYIISDTLYLDSNVKIIGEDKTATIIKQDNNLLNDPLISTNYSDNHQMQYITIKNLTFITLGERTDYFIKLYNCHSTTLKNCRFYQDGTSTSYYHGVEIDKNTGFTGSNFVTKIIDCRFSKCKLKMNSTDSYILHNELWGNDIDCALHLLKASNTSITNNEFIGGKTYGAIYIEGDNEGLKITSNYFDGSYDDIDTKFGIYGIGYLKDSVISNNNFWKQKSGAIYLEKAHTNVISNNVFFENDYYLTDHSDIEIIDSTLTYGNNINNNMFFRTNYYNTITHETQQRPTTNQVPVLRIANHSGYPFTIITDNNASFEQFFSVMSCSGAIISNNNTTKLFYYELNPTLSQMKNDKQIYYYNNNNLLTNKATCLVHNTEKRIDNITTVLNTALTNNFDYNATSSEEYRVYINNGTNVQNKPDFASGVAFIIYLPIVSNTYAIQIVMGYTSGGMGAIKYRMLSNGTWGSWQ